MMFHSKLLAFFAAWFATVGAAFLLPNLEIFAADCNECKFCAEYVRAGIYNNGELNVAYAYIDSKTGLGAPQAFKGGACFDTRPC